MSAISFRTKLYTINDWLILRLPEEVSTALPARGQVMVEGAINGISIRTPLEPDGTWKHHFLHIDEKLQKLLNVKDGDTVEASFTPTKDWSEPEIPSDFNKALQGNKKAVETWQKATPLAHWEWVRSIRSIHPETYERRVRVAIDKLSKGERRPCCWNRNACSEPHVAPRGVLLDA